MHAYHICTKELYNVYKEEIFSKRVLVQEASLNSTTPGAFVFTSTKIITAEMKGTEIISPKWQVSGFVMSSKRRHLPKL